MLNYPLTEFSLKELRALEHVVMTSINDKKVNIESIQKYFSDDSKTKDQLIKNAQNRLPELEEILVRIQTSIQIVSDRQTTNAN